MAQLAIKGHLKRGEEVIQLLKMLGGKIRCDRLAGNEIFSWYYINGNGFIDYMHYSQFYDYDTMGFTLEEFLEKFPYKVGDKVTLDNKLCSITWMCWECNNIYYQVQGIDTMFTKKVTSNDLQSYKEENMEEKEDEPKAPILSNRYDYALGKCGYVIPDGYEFDCIKEGFQTEIILKPKKQTYPKTYVECEKILRCFSSVYVDGYKTELLEVFQKLLICRDAYWKLASAEMGLDEPWEPDWRDSNFKYCLKKMGDNIEKVSEMTICCILSFPTEEMRDAFFENFKDLINDCKELL